MRSLDVKSSHHRQSQMPTGLNTIMLKRSYHTTETHTQTCFEVFGQVDRPDIRKQIGNLNGTWRMSWAKISSHWKVTNVSTLIELYFVFWHQSFGSKLRGGGVTVTLSVHAHVIVKQSGAAGACWAHNPEVDGLEARAGRRALGRRIV